MHRKAMSLPSLQRLNINNALLHAKVDECRMILPYSKEKVLSRMKRSFLHS